MLARVQSELEPSAREDVPAERSLHERREARGTHVARGAHVAREARDRRAEGRRAPGKSRLLSCISFYLDLCVNDCGKAPVGGYNRTV